MVPGLVRVRGVEGQGVEFVVTHDCQGGASIHHGPNELEGLSDLRAPVNEVAKEDSLAFGVLVDALVPGIAQLPEEPLESISVAVDVADEVMHSTNQRKPADNKPRTHTKPKKKPAATTLCDSLFFKSQLHGQNAVAEG